MSKPSCGDCEFWAGGPKDEELDAFLGECRIRSVREWPERHDFDWCGEFRPRAEPPGKVETPAEELQRLDERCHDLTRQIVGDVTRAVSWGPGDENPFTPADTPEQPGPRFGVGQRVCVRGSKVAHAVLATVRKYELTGGIWCSESELRPAEEGEKP